MPDEDQAPNARPGRVSRDCSGRIPGGGGEDASLSPLTGQREAQGGRSVLEGARRVASLELAPEVSKADLPSVVGRFHVGGPPLSEGYYVLFPYWRKKFCELPDAPLRPARREGTFELVVCSQDAIALGATGMSASRVVPAAVGTDQRFKSIGQYTRGGARRY